MVLTVEIDDNFGSLIGYSTTFIDRKALTGQLEQRCPSESSGSMHGEGYIGVGTSMTLNTGQKPVCHTAWAQQENEPKDFYGNG